jgi:transposase InsO family protein
LFLAVILDLFARRVVGRAADGHMRAGLVLDALYKALGHRCGDQTLHHSDQGSQYASRDYQKAAEAAGMVASMSRKGDCWDNAHIESFFGTLKKELIHRYRWATRAQAKMAIAGDIDGFNNPYRRHSAAGDLSPVEYEGRHRPNAANAAQENRPPDRSKFSTLHTLVGRIGERFNRVAAVLSGPSVPQPRG